MINKLRALVGGVALLLVLAACYPGVNSQWAQGYDLQATITKGKVNLYHGVWNAAPEGYGWINPQDKQGYYNFDREIDGNGTANVDLSFSNSRGNWVVNGKWLDGRVQMEFTGKSEYLTALVEHCLSDEWLDNDAGGTSFYDYYIQGNYGGYEYFQDSECDWFDGAIGGGMPAPGPTSLENGVWYKGGCVWIPTLYRSLNASYAGTGHALILVCQNGNPGFNPVTNAWNYPSYIEIWIPDTTNISEFAIGDIYQNFYGSWSEDEYGLSTSFEDGVYYTEGYFQNDNSPFRNYYAGGVNTNRSGKWNVHVRFNNLSNSSLLPTDAPLFNSYNW